MRRPPFRRASPCPAAARAAPARVAAGAAAADASAARAPPPVGNAIAGIGFVGDVVAEAESGAPVKAVTPCEGTIYEVGALSIVERRTETSTTRRSSSTGRSARRRRRSPPRRSSTCIRRTPPLPLHRLRRSSARSSSSATTSPDSRNRLREGAHRSMDARVRHRLSVIARAGSAARRRTRASRRSR